MRFHYLGLAHLETTRENSACAYTQKIIKLAKILKSYGHTVLFYGVEGSQVACDEFVPVSDRQILRETYGDYDKTTNFFRCNPGDKAHETFNRNAIREILARKDERDVLLCPMGNMQKPVADAVGLLTVEPGIGYSGVFAQHRVFESYAWMHYVYGLLGIEDGSWYDCVIPNYFELEDFPFQEKKENYLLYLGRLIGRKGVQTASDVAKATGHTLYVVGQGALENPQEGLHLAEQSHIRYLPAVGPKERAALLQNAKAVLMPTYYLEPFGGVNVEAQLCGTPVITTDWGAFPETVVHGVTGYRCRTFEEFCWAVNHVDALKPQDCRAWAAANYSMERVGRMYEQYFRRIEGLFEAGWYAPNPRRRDLDWLKVRYPH